MIPILIGVTLLLFILFNVFGGDPAQRYAGKYATKAQVENIRQDLGLNLPLPQQYLFFLKQVVTFDYGRSWATKQEISTMVEDGLSPTICLMFPSFAFSVVFCVALSIFVAYLKGTIFDRGTVITCLGLMSISSLVYILALQYLFAYRLGWFPISGWDQSWSGRWSYLVLPWIILFALSLGPDILVYRAVILDEAYQDYVRTARAKGLSRMSVFFRHVLKNAMIPIITIVVIEMPLLLTGTFLIENFFGIPGLGGMMIKALNDSDFPVIKAMTVTTSLLYMLFNLFSDILYSVVDPRVKLG
jgi:peptide/nickel transport system permease protein